MTFECGVDVQAFSLPSLSCTSAALQAASYVGHGQEERGEDVMGDLSRPLDAEQQSVSAELGYFTNKRLIDYSLSHHQKSTRRT